MLGQDHDNALRRDILRIIPVLEDREGYPPHGMAIRDAIQKEYGDDTTLYHSRIYPNIDTLEENGLVERSPRNGRTDEFALTERGERAVQSLAGGWGDAAEALAVGGD